MLKLSVPQSVDKAPNRQNEVLNGLGSSIVFRLGQNVSLKKIKLKDLA